MRQASHVRGSRWPDPKVREGSGIRVGHGCVVGNASLGWLAYIAVMNEMHAVS